MLGYLLLAACIALSLGEQCTNNLPHGNELKKMVDGAFSLMDIDNNGVLSNDELHALWLKDDINHDGNLTLVEYASAWNTSPEILEPVFKVWDSDGDGYVSASHLAKFNHLMDTNDDGGITLQEYEHYMIGFLECAYCHGQHGHGPNCDQ